MTRGHDENAYEAQKEVTRLELKLDMVREDLRRIKREYLVGTDKLGTLAVMEIVEEMDVLIASLME